MGIKTTNKNNTVGKITVKHYLNTSLGRQNRYTKESEYPIYVQITANRKTTKIKSLTNIYCSDETFNEYMDNFNNYMDNPLYKVDFEDDNDENNEKHLKIISKWGDIDNLNLELSEIENIVRYCIRDKGLQIGQFPTSEIVGFYSLPFVSEFGKQINNLVGITKYLLEYSETFPLALYLREDNNPYELLLAIKETTNFDIFDKLSEKHKELIMEFNEFVQHSYESHVSPSLIDWFTGSITDNYLNNSNIKDKSKIDLEALGRLGIIVERNFWNNL